MEPAIGRIIMEGRIGEEGWQRGGEVGKGGEWRRKNTVNRVI